MNKPVAKISSGGRLRRRTYTLLNVPDPRIMLGMFDPMEKPSPVVFEPKVDSTRVPTGYVKIGRDFRVVDVGPIVSELRDEEYSSKIKKRRKSRASRDEPGVSELRPGKGGQPMPDTARIRERSTVPDEIEVEVVRSKLEVVKKIKRRLKEKGPLSEEELEQLHSDLNNDLKAMWTEE